MLIHSHLEVGGFVKTSEKYTHPNIQYADDMVTMPLQCGTQWDALSHIFNEGKMWNGYENW